MDWKYLAAASLSITLAACAQEQRDPQRPQQSVASRPQGPAADGDVHRLQPLTAFVDPGAETFKRPVSQAVAVLYSMSGDRLGFVRFVERGHEGLDVFTWVENLAPGVHAYHVHTYGDCASPDAASAGPHFNFVGSSLSKTTNFITGNLGELSPDADGRVAHQTRIPAARLHGPFSILGRSVVVHANPNDPTQPPDGGAGARIACGVIGIGNPIPQQSPSDL